ncbi:MAG: 50S ribosomal protein L6 [Francisellaceae bacterium]|jgi:large subunit ribosomal protein L6|nr:50S ribosomal protein L6 [Francisellaceae bacterium]MBT6539114.1 50S ribosomal protein L6 [Francisellaceae bacterium]
MSRIARKPLTIPQSVTIEQVEAGLLAIKGPNGQFSHVIHKAVNISIENNEITLTLHEGQQAHKAQLGTACVLLSNCIVGVTKGFEKKLTLVGVGYRGKLQGKAVELSLGYSHPVIYPIPEGITIEMPSATEIVIKGADKQQVGQVAAEIRMKRRPEPYKGKGVRYSDEQIILKETKKK